MAGRRPTPAVAKKRAGNPGKRPLPKGEAKTKAAGRRPAPVWLGQYGKQLWRRLAPELDGMGLLKTIDIAAFEGLCDAYDSWRNAAAAIKKHGRTYTVGGLIRPRPEVTIAKDARKEMRMFAAEFGLTPSARSRVESALSGGEQPTLPGAQDWPAHHDPARMGPEHLAPELSDDDYFASSARH